MINRLKNDGLVVSLICDNEYTDLSEGHEETGQRRCHVVRAFVHQLHQDGLQVQDPLEQVLRQVRVAVRVRMTHDRAQCVQGGIEKLLVLDEHKYIGLAEIK